MAKEPTLRNKAVSACSFKFKSIFDIQETVEYYFYQFMKHKQIIR